MLKNYLKVAFRNLIRYKGYSFINIAGMAVGIAVFLMIIVFAVWELSWENFHLNRDHIVRASIEFGSEGNKTHFAGAMPALGPALVSQLPKVENSVRFRRAAGAMLRIGEKQFSESNFFFVDSSVFEVFSFIPVHGNLDKALCEPFSIVLTEKLASKFFGTKDPIGQSIIYMDSVPLQVTAVIKDIPLNTLLRTDIMISYNSLSPLGMASKQPWNQWGMDQTYLLVTEGTCLDSLYSKMNPILLKNTNKWFSEHITFRLDHLSDIYLNSRAAGEFGPVGNIMLVYLLIGVGFLVLIIACLNYINLTTSRSVKRLKEISVRKVVGATRFQLICQVLIESIVVATLSGLFGLVMYELFFPTLTSYIGSSVAQDGKIHYLSLIFLVSTVLLIGLSAGGVPAWFISGKRAVSSIMIGQSILPGKVGLRRVLVIIQFTLSIGLIFSSYAVYNQLLYMKNSDLGFDKKNVVLVSFPKGEKSKEKYTLIKNEFSQVQGVTAISGAYTVPGINSREEMSIQKQGAAEDQSQTVRAVSVDKDYIDVLGLEIVEGQKLAEIADMNKERSVILSQSAVSRLQLKNPIGQTIYRPAKDGMVPVTVVGVIKDFHISSLRKKIDPLMLYIDSDKYYYVAIRINTIDPLRTLAAIEQKWQKMFPDIIFESSFLESTYDSIYQSEKTISELLALFTGLAVFISCLGLLGLAAYLAEQRTKEIGIRKVLGASVTGIVKLLTKEIMVLVVISNIIALPIAYYAIQKWLQNFAYRAEIGIGIFILTASAIMLIALITVSYQAIIAAQANPVDALRYE